MNPKRDKDLLALKGCLRSLNKCKTPRTVKATLQFLWDYYVANPSKELPEHLK